MPVGEEDMEVEPDHVYVMPPDQNMAFSDGTLKLTPRTQTPGRAMPIDHFFRSVAEDRGSTAIGVILSGTGSGGTLGWLHGTGHKHSPRYFREVMLLAGAGAKCARPSSINH